MTAIDNAIITQPPRHVDLVFVDDDDFFVNNFIRFFLQNKIIDKYHTAQEFLTKVAIYAKNTKFLIDNQLKDDEDIDGIKVAAQLHIQGFTQLYLLSGREYINNTSIPEYLTPILKTDIDIITGLVGIRYVKTPC